MVNSFARDWTVSGEAFFLEVGGVGRGLAGLRPGEDPGLTIWSYLFQARLQR